MCGIFGIVDLGPGQGGGAPIDEARFRTGLATLQHRGPDGQRATPVDSGVMLGHARLSIIDLSDDSAQPMLLNDRYWLTYNGEIFNYLELRAELEAAGVRFSTSGDTEVLLQAYAHWGPACVSRFNGMWAFAIWDRQERTLFASRDRFGIKPFNYAIVAGQLLFASEIKAMLAYHPALAEPDYTAIASYCRASVGAQHERTWFRQVKRLMPGTNLLIRQGQLSLSRYWHYPYTERREADFDAACQDYRALFEDAVRLRMRSDVPLGITLSAGVDSSSIACAMQAAHPVPHHSFTARFVDADGLRQDPGIYQDGDRPIDESVVAGQLASQLGLTPHIVDTDYGDFVGSVRTIISFLESGNSSPAVIPLMQLLARAREHLTVVMDGQGADELLAGYVAPSLSAAIRDLLTAGRWRAAMRSIREYGRTYTLKSALVMTLRGAGNRIPGLMAVQQRLRGLADIYGPELRDAPTLDDFPSLLEPHGRSRLARALREQHSGGLVNLLHYGDAISMANSLEARMPFLDHRLVEFVWSLPSDYKLRLGVGKYVHRQAMRGIVPDAILDERVKFGFNTPIGQQFRKDYPAGQGPLDILLSDRCLARGLFDRRGLTRLVEAHRSGRVDHGPLLFRLLSTELWFRNFIDPLPAEEASHG